MSELILYHYGLSPFSEKVRAMLGYAEMTWRSVEVAEMPPRPLLDVLTGGYRRIPVAQVGADVYCDTRSIARLIARLSDRPELVVERQSEDVQAFVRETDLQVFLSCVMYASGPGMLYKLWQETSLVKTARFLTDRIRMGRKARVPGLSPARAGERVRQHVQDLNERLSGSYLFGETPCIADFSAFHGLWFVCDLAGKDVAEPYPKVLEWMERMRYLGHGESQPLDPEQAIQQARDANPAPMECAGADAMLNRTVSIAPSDYGREPVVGTLVGASPHEWVVRREHPRTGVVHVHLPRVGFSLHPADD